MQQQLRDADRLGAIQQLTPVRMNHRRISTILTV